MKYIESFNKFRVLITFQDGILGCSQYVYLAQIFTLIETITKSMLQLLAINIDNLTVVLYHSRYSSVDRALAL